MSLSDEIVAAVHKSRLSQYRIAAMLGIGESTVSRFVNGKGGLSMQNLDALAELLNLSVVVGKAKAKITISPRLKTTSNRTKPKAVRKAKAK